MSDTPIKKQALLIGINQYQILSQLKYARQDAEAVADSLKQNYRFSEDEIMLLTDAKQGLFKPTNRYIIQEHLEKLANQELDLFIFGFWGHGLVRNGKRYLCPLDVMGSRAEYQGLPFDQVQELLAKIHAKNTCIILDCCQTVHDRGEAETLTVSDQTSMENAARDIVLRRKEQISNFQSNVAILNSCKEGQCAYEWDARKHGLFTAHLLDAMNKRSNSVMQITSYISSNIEKTALELGKEQTPFYKLEGDIVLPVETKSTPLVTGDVFISYRHCNADLVEPIEAELKRRKISYFIDRVGINYSMDYSTVIARAIRACKVLLVVWTKEANYSKDMLREVKMALDLNKSVVPYKIGTFNAIDHDALYFQLSPLSRCETAIQTPETISDVINQVEQALMRTPNPQPVIDAPDNLNDIVIQNPIAEGNSADDKPAQAEQSQPDPQNESSSSSWSSFKFEATITVFIGEETEVTIPDGVTEIGCGAFENCSSLKSVTIPDSVKTIKNAAFRNCSSLTSVTIPNHASIGVEAFAGCTSLKEWPDFSKNIYYRSDGAGLLNNNYLIACLASAKEYQVPERVTVIRDSAFSGCRFLTSVTLPKSVKKIEDGVFSDCSALTSIAIPDGVTVIGKSVFSGCKSLTSITLPDSLTKINVKAFSNCSSLESVKIPEGVTEIESNVFTGCSSLKSITFPGSLT
ncbi:MAG: leucine-rich repeat protein, partial [Thermoguttaceae bacterium]|nr:leucine-rich repeat protein [Thermoguttaceae bacterium]